jgi:hypothetical protein
MTPTYSMYVFDPYHSKLHGHLDLTCFCGHLIAGAVGPRQGAAARLVDSYL